MSDFEMVICTALAALIGGVILLVMSELIKVIIIFPVQKTKEKIQITLSKVDFHCNYLTNFFSKEPSDEELAVIKSIRKDLREASTDLNSAYTTVPMKKLLSLVNILPDQERTELAVDGLIYLHNSILYEGRRDYIDNSIQMNINWISRIRAALSGKDIPEAVPLKESSS